MNNPYHLASMTASILSASITLASLQQSPKNDVDTKHNDTAHAAIEQVEIPRKAVAVLAPTQGHEITGAIMLTQTQQGVSIQGRVKGLAPGKHGFHIHEFGDLTAADGKSAGDHYNPTGQQHAGPEADERHLGDLGNIEADSNGVAQINTNAKDVQLHLILGRSLVIHAEADDLKSQPSGDSGGRVAVGVIGVAQH